MRQLKLWILIFIVGGINSLSLAASRSDLSSSLWGKWRFIGYIYLGQFQEPPNPYLVLTFEFLQDGTDTLHWHRINEDGFCERRGNYSYDGQELVDTITWIHPGNAFECSRDPDMVLGKTQVTPLRNDEDRLYMDLPLSDEILTYVWEKEIQYNKQGHWGLP